jgi:mannan endo-1,4-beta-mannosidase
LWNEFHGAHAGDRAVCWGEFFHDLSTHVRTLEIGLYGRSHPQTVSLFGPELALKADLAPEMRDAIFRHPDLDFATIHIYAKGSIDHPRDTVAPAVAMGKVVRDSLAEITDGRPFLDTEHGPIHTFKDKRRTLPELFDDEYFRHLSWAHLASGGVGGGMRWPNRHPHTLTTGMRRAQHAMAQFLPLLDWPAFRRRNLNHEVRVRHFHPFACGNERQGLVWLLRRNTLAGDGRVRADAVPVEAAIELPGLADGRYRVRGWGTSAGTPVDDLDAHASGGLLRFTSRPIVADRAFAITPA